MRDSREVLNAEETAVVKFSCKCDSNRKFANEKIEIHAHSVPAPVSRYEREMNEKAGSEYEKGN